jgi:hypothetical protein
MRYCGRNVVSVGLQSEKHFRTIDTRGLGNGAFLAVVAVPRINKLRVINALNASTPAASTTLCIFNKLRAYRNSNCAPFSIQTIVSDVGSFARVEIKSGNRPSWAGEANTQSSRWQRLFTFQKTVAKLG